MADLTISIDIDAAKFSAAIDELKKGIEGLKNALGGSAKEGANEAAAAADQASRSFSSLANDALQETIRQALATKQAFASLAREGVDLLDRQVREIEGTLASVATQGLDLAKKHAAEAEKAFISLADQGMMQTAKQAAGATQALISLAGEGIREAQRQASSATQAFQDLGARGFAEAQRQAQGVIQAFNSLGSSGIAPLKNQLQEAKTAFLSFVNEGIQLAGSRAAQAGQTLNAFATNGIAIVKNHAAQAKESLVSLVQGGIDMAGTRVEQAKQAFLGLAKSGLEEVKNKAANAKQAFEDFAKNGIEQIKTRVQEAKTSLMDLAGGAVERAKSALESLTKIDLAGMSEKIKGFGEKLKGVADFLKNNITSPLTSFWGKDDASKKIEDKIAKFKERVNSLLSKLFAPVMPYLEQGVDALIGIVDRVIEWFDNAPQSVRVFIAIIASIAVAIGPVIGVIASAVIGVAGLVSAISAIAAAGTVSVVVGAIAAAIALLVAGIGIAIGVVYGLHEAWAAGFGPIASIVAIAVGLIITAFSPILGLPILIGAVAVTIYELWAANFGGLQDFTTQVWAKIQEYIAIAMAAIEQLVAEIGADVIAWWTENYPLIEQTVQTVSDAVKAYIEGFLNAIKAFWDAHGEQIMSVVRSIWTIISTIVRTGVNVIMQVVRMVMQIINGDWAGAWNTAKDIVSRIITAIGTVLGELGNIVWQALKFVVTAIVNIGTEVVTKAVSVGKSLVQGLIDGIKSLGGVLWDAAKGIISGAIDAMKKAAFINSPSRATMDVGNSLAEGLAMGMNNQAVQVEKSASKLVKGAVKKMVEEVTKAQKEFEAFARTTPEKQAQIVKDANYSDGKSKLDQIIKLRAELGKDVGSALPKTLEDVNRELKTLSTLSDGVKEAGEMLKQFEKVGDVTPKTNVQKADAFFNDKESSGAVSDDMRSKINAAAVDADKRVQAEAFSKVQDKILAGYATSNTQLTEEIALLQRKRDTNFALTEVQERQFRNDQEIFKMRAEAEKNGAGQQEIEELAKKMAAQFEAVEALRAQKQALTDQDKLYSDTIKDQEATLAKLNEQLGVNTALTEADRLKKLQLTDAYKALTQEQKNNIAANSEKIKEAQAKAKEQEDAKAAEENVKKQMEKFKGFISDSLKTLADKGFGAVFKSIFDKFKQMLIDMATEWISSQIYKLIFKEGGKGFGDMIGKALQSLGIAGKKGGSVAAPSGGGGGGTDAHEAAHAKALADKGADAAGGGLFGPKENIITGKTSKLAGTMSGIGSLMALAGGIIGGRVGGIISMAGTGMSIGAMFGPWGAAIGAVAGGLIGLFMGDPKKKIDKKENMPKLQKGFTEALQQLRDLLNDRNQIFSDPDGAIQRAMDIRGQIASGFGIEFQSKKYKKIAQQQIAAKVIEADAIIKQIKEMADVARMAGKVDSRLEAEFATGVYADRAFIKQHADFKRRNGLLPGGWTGSDTLPSMLAPGEMVLNPKQIARVKFNAGFDAFKGAGIPNYAAGTFVGPSASSGVSAVPSAPQPVTVQIVLNNSGIVESDIKGVLVNGLKQSDVQVELVKAYDKGKTRTRN